MMNALKAMCVLLAAVLMFGALPALAGDIQHGPTETKRIKVPGNKDWVNTGIKMIPGDSVVITATGKVYFNEETGAFTSPEGYKRSDYEAHYFDDFNQCGDPFEQWDHAALVGEVGNNVFYVGPRKVIAKKEGMLYLGINDCTLTGPKPLDNAGFFDVTITVSRKK